MVERSGILKFKGQDVNVVGTELRVGDPAPDFLVQTQEWAPFHGLADTQGKVRILAAVPSLDTEVCDRETRRFNQEAAALGGDITILVISADLPFAQKRWCGAAGIDQLIVLSDHMRMDFGTRYGCLIQDVRLLARSVFVVNRSDRITYAAYLSALGVEPEYAEVLAAARSALAET